MPSAVAFGAALSVGAVRAGFRCARGLSDESENRPLIHPDSLTFLREAVTFSREAVKFFSKAVKFSRAAVTFFGRNSHQPRQNSFYDLSHHACKYIIVITVNEPSPLAPLTPALGAGGVGGVGCFLLVPIIIRARAAAGATPLTSHLSPLTSPYMDSLTEKHLAHLAHVAPNSCCAGLQGQEVRGGMGDMGGMFSAFTTLRARNKRILPHRGSVPL